MQARTESVPRFVDTSSSEKPFRKLVADEEVYRTLYEIVARLVLPLDLPHALNDILMSSLSVVNADGGYIRLFGLGDTGPVDSRYPFAASHGISAAYLEYFGALPKAVDRDAREAVFEGKRVIVEDMFTAPAFAAHRKIVVAEGFRSMQATPLMSRSGSLCVGAIITCFYDVFTPSQEKFEMLDVYAELAAAAIERKLMVKRRVEREAHVQAVANRQRESLRTLRSRIKSLQEGAFWAEPAEFKRATRSLVEDLDTVLLDVQELDLPPGNDLQEPVPSSGHSYDLSSRELHVLKLIWDGLSDKQIATSIGISRYTVYKHVGSILRKLGVESRTQASILAEREGLFKVFTPEPPVANGEASGIRHRGRVNVLAGRAIRHQSR